MSSTIFVNEIHYDNRGVDAGEAIEIAGPAGTNLSGWSLVLYNGSTGLEYDMRALGGTLPDEQNGVGTLQFSYPTNGLQNGDPDGIALVDPAANVVQFLSYEGAFTANDGPALGMMSTDIGVAESSATPFGFSMQLVGTGRESSDFSWAASNPQTFGALNNPVAGPTDLFFSEYLEGSGLNKAIEIFNGTTGEIDLSNYQLEFYFNGSTTAGTTISLNNTLLGIGGVWVVADDGADAAILASTDQTSIGNFFNGDDAVALRNNLTNLLIDVIGQIGFDPGSEWSGGGLGTRDEGLRRNSGVVTGDSDGSDAFDPSQDWFGIAENDFLGLGVHDFSYPNEILPGQSITPRISNPVPLPSTHLLMMLGLITLCVKVRRRVTGRER